MARRLGQPYAIFRALLNCQFALNGAARPADRLPLADEAIELARSIGNPNLVTAALGMKAPHLLALGRLSEVIELHDECARKGPRQQGPDRLSASSSSWPELRSKGA